MTAFEPLLATHWRQPLGHWPRRGACPEALRLGLGAACASWPAGNWHDDEGHTLWHYWACCPDPVSTWPSVRQHADAECRDRLSRDGAHPWHWLAMHGSAEAMAHWHAVWGTPRLSSWRGDSVLHCAAWSANLPTLRLALPGSDEGLNVLDAQGVTPLIISLYRGQMEHVMTLIEAGADPDMRDPHGRSALHHAALLGNVDLLGKLEDAGGDIRLADREGDTPESVMDDRLDMSAAQVTALRQHWARRYQSKLRL